MSLVLEHDKQARGLLWMAHDRLVLYSSNICLLVRLYEMKALQSRLVANGCDLSIVDFQDRLVDILSEMFSSWSVDELMLHPRDALDYCTAVRRQISGPGLPDDLILRCLMARRKNP